MKFLQHIRIRSITWQIIISSVTPVFIALIGLAAYNYFNAQKLQKEAYNTKRKIVNNEMNHIFSLQETSLNFIENELNSKMKKWSHQIIYNYLDTLKEFNDTILNYISLQLGMDTALTDIYIIDRTGVIVYSTFFPDLGLNLFSFGDSHKNFLLNIFKNKKFHPEPFTNESQTNRLKKYSYQATKDGKYIVEIGSYSKEANQLNNKMISIFKDISTHQIDFREVDLFIVSDVIYSFTKRVKVPPQIAKIVRQVFESKTKKIVKKTDTQTGITLYYDYSNLDKKFQNTALYKGAVMLLVYDKEKENAKNRKELLLSLNIFSIVTLLVALIIFLWSRRITKPIKDLAKAVEFITEGDLNKQVEVKGKNEIAQLAQSFNKMMQKLNSFYKELEDKVKERTKELSIKNEEISQQRNSLKSQNKRILSSIRYAQTIQKAILPNLKPLQAFINYFVLYRPKDVVSGDSYWTAKIQKHDRVSIIFAVIDCTGHGVPGAFMTLIADRLLNSIVNEKRIYSPAEILERLDEGVRQMLKQEDSNNDDGMDLSLVRIDFFKNGDRQLVFSGAKRPIIFYQYEEKNIELIKGSIRAIGGNRYGLDEPFKNIELTLNKNDLIYMYSDGIIDQRSTGGILQKAKYGTKRLLEFINKYADDSMTEQLIKLENELDEHQGDFEQLDDITIVGIRF